MQLASDVVDAAAATLCLLPPQPAPSAADAATLPVLVSCALVADDDDDDDHTYHHSTARKSLDARSRHARYVERRRKNNRACQLSRAKRRQRVKDQEDELVRLGRVNAELRQRIAEMERDRQRLKSALVGTLGQS